MGLCRDFPSGTLGHAKLLAWNKEFSAGDSRYPPVQPDKLTKGSLACTHLNLTARLFKHGMTTVEGVQCVVAGDKKLEDFVRLGHKWHVLSGETPDDVAVEASAWLNSSNNTSQARNPAHMALHRATDAPSIPMSLAHTPLRHTLRCIGPPMRQTSA